MKPPMFARLGDHHEVIISSFEEWQPWAQEHLFNVHDDGPSKQHSIRVGASTIYDRASNETWRVSTMFLGMNSNPRQPTWFETVVFGGPCGGERQLYSTWAEAEAGHKAVTERVRGLAEQDHG